ncbi:autotransporter domain-containing protein [Lysobacter antibioticus]|uniref:Autotransporter beta-domain protein n=1 Tax=Lysobacter antibioticus TaxID=84531 RepID=A0A0S2F5T7_LYSAN|nr:autotransporter domain-containing protein [Lysobacter antibioticus]ALN78917.1 autotransporter beta-domain protein [Lysobacter antibioticus]
MPADARRRLRLHPLSRGIAQAIPLLIALQMFAGQARAACTPAAPTDGATVSCTGVPILLPPNPNSFLSNANNLDVTVQAGAIMSTLPGGTAMSLGGTGLTLNNLGAIDANAAGSLVLARALAVGNLVAPTSGNVAINNQGSIEGTFDGTFGLGGSAMLIANAGTTTIANSGSIGMSALGLFDPVNSVAVAIYGGGNVNFTNTGTITGRVAFASPGSGGNVFVNAGTINGSVSLGTALSNDTFVAVTGSTLGNPLIPLPPVTVPTPTVPPGLLTFAATGTVDAGVGGFDTLVLQNTVAGPGSGTGGSGSISALQYLNFENLTVNSGTWTLSGAVVSGSATLNGGLSLFDNALAFGTGTLTGNGGAIEASLPGLTLTQNVNLTGGLIVQGGNSLSLGGTVGGAGGLIKNGTGTLSLLGSNNFSGGLALNAGGLTLGSAGSLGTGLFLVGGPATLNTAFSGTLTNQVQLNGALTLNGAGALTLAGNINGAGSLTLGSGALALTGSNNYSGGTVLQAGSIDVGNNSALGTGALTVNGAGSLTGAAGVTLSNNIVLNNTLNFGAGGSGGALTLNGTISGAGGISLAGASGVTLNGSNIFSGGFNLGGGALTVGSNTALGSGAVTVSGAGSLDANTALSLANNFNLNAGLNILGSNDLALNGSIGGLAGLTKSGAATLSLGNANAFAGGVNLLGGGLSVGTSTSLGLGALTVNGAANFSSTTAVNLGNAVVLNADLGVGGSNDIAFGGLITGAGGLNYGGSATLSLNGANGFGGGVGLASGNLSVGNNLALGTGSLDVSGNAGLNAGVPGIALSNNVNLGTGTTLALSGANALALNGTIAGDGGLSINGSGAFTLGGSNSFGGGVSLASGSLLLGTDASLGTGTLGVTGNASLASTGAALNLGNAINLGAGAGLTLGGAADLSFGGTIGGAGSLIKTGAGAVSLNGANNFGGGFDLQAGTLNLGTDTALGSGALSVNGAATLNASTALNVSNAINLNAALSIGGANDLALGGSIGGSGGLSFNGPATLTLSGANAFNGGVALGGGTLAVGSDLALGSGALNVGGNAGLTASAANIALANAINLGAGTTLAISGANALSLDGSIGGAGGLAMNGTGTLELGGANLFGGGVALNAGTLGVGNNLALGTGTLSVGGDAELTATAPAIALGNAITLASGAQLGIGGANDLALNGTIGGAGSLAFDGSGTLTLGAANTFGGGFDLDAGTLALGSSTALGSGALDVGGNANLSAAVAGIDLANTVNVGAGSALSTIGNNALTLSGTVMGSGTLIKAGSAALTLSGNVAGFAGGLSVQGGTLNVGNPITAGFTSAAGTSANFSGGVDQLSATGAIAGAVDLGGGDDRFYSSLANLAGITGSINGNSGSDTFAVGGSGEGSLPWAALIGFEQLNLAAGGTLILPAGGTANFANSAIAGNLVLNGSLTGNAVVAAGGALIGDGALTGALTLGGTLAPSGLAGATGAAGGNGSVGASLNVASLTFNPGATLQVRQTGAGVTDSVIVAGTASLNGGQVVAIPQAGSYAPVTDYRIVDAGAISGAFTGVSQTALPFLDATLVTIGNDVFLRLSEHDAGGSGIRFNQFPGLSGNQQAVANALQTIADANSGQLPTLIAAARGLSAAQAPRAFDTLSGETYASIVSAQRYNAEQLQRSVARQLDRVRDAGVEDEDTLGTLWATAYGGRAEFDGEGLAGIDNSLAGFAMGLEGSPGANFRFGGHVGMAHSKMETDRRDDQVEADLFNVGIQWLYAPGPFWTQGAVGYSYASYDAEREIAVGTFNARTDAHFSGDGVYGMLEAGWRWDGASLRIEPLLGVYYSKLEAIRFSERGGGDANLVVSSDSFDATTAGIGVRFSGLPGQGARKWQPTADIRYLRDLQDDRPFARNAFAGASVPDFGVNGFVAERNRWNVGLGLSYRLSPVSSGFIEYRGDIGSDDRAHSLNMGLRLGWGGKAAVAAARAAPWAGAQANAGGVDPAATTSSTAKKASPAPAVAAAAVGSGTAVAASPASSAGTTAPTATAPANYGYCPIKPAGASKAAGSVAKAKARAARPISKSKRVASRGTGITAKPRRSATRLAAQTPPPAPPSGAVALPSHWCDEASARVD